MPKSSAPKLIVSNRRRALWLLLASLGLALPLLVVQSGTTATAGPVSWPTSMKFSGLSTAETKAASGSKPNVLAAINTDIEVTVEFNSDLPKDTPLAITSTAAKGPAPIPGVVTAPGGVDSRLFTFHVHFDQAVNDIGLIATVTKGPAKDLSTGPSESFDVLTALRMDQVPADATSFTAGFGGDDGHCGNAADADGQRVCEILVLPSAPASDVFFSTGLCAGYSCKDTGTLVQTLFADGNEYGQSDPATLVIKCDKSLCGTGPLRKVDLLYSLKGNGALTETPGDCPAKNTLGPDLQPCIDWVQTKRDGSGDSHYYLLFAKDIRVGAS